jgi:tol-pal system protein YbgF
MSTFPFSMVLSRNSSSPRRSYWRLPALLLAAAALCTTPVFAASKEIIQLQTQVQQLQDAVARLQQSNDERMGVMKDLVQQSADAVNKMSANLDALHKQMVAQQEAQNTKTDQISGQIQSLNDSLDELKTRLAHLEKLTQDVQNQQQSMGAALQNPSQAGATGATAPPAATSPAPTDLQPATPATVPDRAVGPASNKKGKPAAGTPVAAASLPPASLPPTPTTNESAAPPVDELYKTALGDYMSAKYSLAESEFGDVVKSYPDNPLAGNAYYYQAEIEYRAGKYPAAIKYYDKVLDQYPDNNKVPVSHLHKGQALIAQKQTDAGVRELRALIQRFPNSPEAMSARSKLNGMGVPVTPRHPAQ